jgi:hypothetical protein
MSWGCITNNTACIWFHIKQTTSYFSTVEHHFLQGAYRQKGQHHNPRKAHCFLACSGISLTSISTGTPFSSDTQSREKSITIINRNFEGINE